MGTDSILKLPSKSGDEKIGMERKRVTKKI